MRRLTLSTIILAIVIVVLAIIATTFNLLPPVISTVAVTIFTLLGITFALFQWLLPLSSTKTEIKDNKEVSLDSLSEEVLGTPLYESISEVVLELKKDVKNVVKEVEHAQDAIVQEQPELEITKDVSDDIDEVLHIASVNPRATLLLLSAKIEERMRLRLQETGLQPKTNYALSRKAIDLAVTEGLIPIETVSAFRDFLALRNKIAHGAAFDVDEATILSLVSIGIELLKLVSARKQKNAEISNSEMP